MNSFSYIKAVLLITLLSTPSAFCADSTSTPTSELLYTLSLKERNLTRFQLTEPFNDKGGKLSFPKGQTYRVMTSSPIKILSTQKDVPVKVWMWLRQNNVGQCEMNALANPLGDRISLSTTDIECVDGNVITVAKQAFIGSAIENEYLGVKADIEILSSAAGQSMNTEMPAPIKAVSETSKTENQKNDFSLSYPDHQLITFTLSESFKDESGLLSFPVGQRYKAINDGKITINSTQEFVPVTVWMNLDQNNVGHCVLNANAYPNADKQEITIKTTDIECKNNDITTIRKQPITGISKSLMAYAKGDKPNSKDATEQVEVERSVIHPLVEFLYASIPRLFMFCMVLALWRIRAGRRSYEMQEIWLYVLAALHIGAYQSLYAFFKLLGMHNLFDWMSLILFFVLPLIVYWQWQRLRQDNTPLATIRSMYDQSLSGAPPATMNVQLGHGWNRSRPIQEPVRRAEQILPEQEVVTTSQTGRVVNIESISESNEAKATEAMENNNKRKVFID